MVDGALVSLRAASAHASTQQPPCRKDEEKHSTSPQHQRLGVQSIRHRHEIVLPATGPQLRSSRTIAPQQAVRCFPPRRHLDACELHGQHRSQPGQESRGLSSTRCLPRRAAEAAPLPPYIRRKAGKHALMWSSTIPRAPYRRVPSRGGAAIKLRFDRRVELRHELHTGTCHRSSRAGDSRPCSYNGRLYISVTGNPMLPCCTLSSREVGIYRGAPHLPTPSLHPRPRALSRPNHSSLLPSLP